MLNRKQFLRGVGAGAAAWALAGRVAAAEPGTAVARALPGYDDAAPENFWREVRAAYGIAPDLAYLNCGGLGPMPAPVRAKLGTMTEALNERVDAAHGTFDEARKVMAGFLGGMPDEVCFTRNATEGNSIIAAGLALAPGDEVIFETHAHPGGSLPWLNQARRRGVVVRVFEPDAASAGENVRRMLQLVTPRTKAVQVSHVTAPTGVVMPVAEMAAELRKRNIWFHVDGAQSLGVLPIDVQALGCDSYAASGHKWLGGPRETGVLWIRAARLDDVAPTDAGAYTSCDFDFCGRLVYAAGARRHEFGTRNAAAIGALAEAVRWQQAIGRERIARRAGELARRVREGLASIKGVTVLTPSRPELCGAMTTFKLAGHAGEVLQRELMRRDRLRCRTVTEEKLDALRVSTHVFNTPDECDRVVAAVSALARA
ncbi:aminotransferase class V-fold PLP-dependent enzyme [Opitutus sp. ER46]|uniref:aminotransferase class V-fold PLP-dependent enzyme n=1 Tax=Opitutus sp. ER46 TaxID=2161864 RepID=UPI000D31C4FB|nr:aminotransferase class V-fold PLP-dependent enzyme [Opitutus sp. ER46]PTX94474.1 hypothetical protein DB354_12070 [Opitutus sp. ER46]